MAESHLPPSRIPAWGWILLLLALVMFAGLLVAVMRDHQRLRRIGLAPGDAPAWVAAAPASPGAPLATG
ncbi:MAG TPA: hypothetical protein VF048_00130 [Gemmatimonadaceae bacterium]|jgi:hypothetical protein